MPYDPSIIEPTWQRAWRESGAFRTSTVSDKPKFYILDMFPYPSGNGLHVGHLKGYVASDVVARYKRMRGFNVLHPMGFDSFGLPTERQAEREGIAPHEVTTRNIATFRNQLELVGLGYDWDRAFATSDPAYYRWTQWIFQRLYERGLAYQTDAAVNWCPALGTVLANEEVENGRYKETGDIVEQRHMRQWMLRITAYADRLVDDLADVDWPEHVKELQRKWIGRAVDPETGEVSYNLRDWLFSRQRYWGEPIPVIHGPGGEIELEPRLPLELPAQPESIGTPNTTDPTPPLAHATSWGETTMPGSGAVGRRETNVMPQWAGSSWYYLRFLDPHNSSAAWDREIERAWMPVDLYVGGVEHATLHLLYSRFWHKVFFDLGLVSTKEPFRRLFTQGMIHARSFRDEQGRYYYPHDVEEGDGRWRARETGVALETRIEKMSKTRRNVERPEPLVAAFGADSLRLYEMFLGPVEASTIWQSESIVGMRRFLDRVWRMFETSLADPLETDDEHTARLVEHTIKKVGDDIEALRLNTAVSQLMIFVNHATEHGGRVSRGTLDRFVRVLAPFAPHLAEELYRALGNDRFALDATWPDYDESRRAVETVHIAVQVDGRTRVRIERPREDSTRSIEDAATTHPSIQPWLAGKTILKTIHVPGKLVNFVLARE